METNGEPRNQQEKIENGFTNAISTGPLEWLEHITVIDLSNKKLKNLEDNVKFPPKLLELNLSHNKFTATPTVVLNLKGLKSLDMSYNELKYFDETPNFCHSIEVLNLSYNGLLGPPYWVWLDFPTKLSYLDLSFNIKITHSFRDGYYEELMQYKTPVLHLKINNCDIYHHMKLLNTFTKVKTLDLGSQTLTRVSVNRITDFPSEGLDNCCDIRNLNLTNTHVYNVKRNIEAFSNLVEINLSQNFIAGLPIEFCNLHNLETCILSNNSLLYLPDDIGKLKKLVKLRIDSNELCLLPDSIVELTNLDHLDIYNNCLYEFPEEIEWVTEVDFAQNYFDEPSYSEYIVKKENLRLNITGRFDGRKNESVRPESDRSQDITDDEEYCRSHSDSNSGPHNFDLPSSPEDWDSDDYWVPQFCGYVTQPVHLSWLEFVKRKMAEGNFCPMDAHTVPIAEKVRYEKLCQPRIEHESDGQFDDFSDDDS